jgi:hypothetical protein
LGVCNHRIIGALVCAMWVGCGQGVQRQACMSVSGPGPLVSGAEVFRLQVFSRGEHCQGPTVAAPATEPMLTRSFGQGQPIALELPTGHYAFLLTTFADLAETMAMGQGCSEASLSAGAQVCFDLTLAALPAHGGECLTDYACVGAAGGTCCANQCADLATDIANCSACGVACDTTASVGAACSGTGCRYSGCAPDRVDCNQQAPNADGCECVGAACCATASGGMGCQTRHDNGVGGHFDDCVALDTYNGDQAQKAYDSAPQFAGGALVFTCVGGGSDLARALCKTGPNSCVCWWYEGQAGFADAPGLVSLNPTGSSCPCFDVKQNAHWH